MGSMFPSFFSDWKMGEWIPSLILLALLVGVAIVVWVESTTRKARTICACFAIVLGGTVVVTAVAQANIDERKQKQQEKTVQQADIDHARQDLSWVRKLGYEIVELTLVNANKGEGRVLLARDNCELGIGLRFWKVEYFLVLSTSSRKISPELFETLFLQVCLSRQPTG
jgi:multisubunit Na+/H+ antiporter MnhG subunit